MAKKNKNKELNDGIYGNVRAYDPLMIGSGKKAPKNPKTKQYDSPFSEFERDWYKAQGYQDPGEVVRKTKTVTKQASSPNPSTSLLLGGNNQKVKYNYRGVSEEARNQFLAAFGGSDPTSGVPNAVSMDGDLYSKNTIFRDDTGVGNVFNLIRDIPDVMDNAPTLIDPNEGRNILRIGGRRFF